MGRKKIRIWPFRFFVPLLFCSLWLYTPVFGHAAQESSGYVPDYEDIQAFLDEQDAELSFGEMVDQLVLVLAQETQPYRVSSLILHLKNQKLQGWWLQKMHPIPAEVPKH